MKIPLFTLLLCAGIPGQGPECQAQPSTPSYTPRFSIGVQTAQNRYVVFYPTTVSTRSIKPWMVTAGVQFTPRFLLQVGYGYSHEETVEDPSGTGTTLTGQQTSGVYRYASRAWAVPLLTRYTLTRRPLSRVQFDLLSGATLAAARFSGYSDSRIDGQIISSTSYGGRATPQLYATAGVGARVWFGKHWHLVWDITLNRNLHASSRYTNLETTGNRWGLTRSANLGVQYRFGWPKKVQAAARPAPQTPAQ
ncbi:hypothetical protein [Hymenobacter elongatus]|uniref:Outer membrane protein beta-barrel domain-containing protein n=1 Tax=Hymenobacter elongatus TaxID=877208 RepID=A0A4Z0PTI7_9BACT|nr:hypothetical protein [Hymenobacter elongatus]TGE19712.1 hypothetical protein E5J99_02830 [Hymenobacter elongatus]